MYAVWLIALKDLRLRLRDRSLFIVAFVAPFGLAFIFNGVFGGGADRISFDIGVADLDRGTISQGFDAMLSEVEGSGLITITRYAGDDEARGAVDDGDVDAAIVVPEGLSDSVQRGAPSRMDVIGDVDRETAAAVATSLTRSYATSVGTGRLAAEVSVATGAVDAARLDDVARQVAASPPLAAVTDLDVESTRLDITTSMVAGLSLFFVFFVAGFAVTGVLEERDAGTLPRLLAAPAPRRAILGGKAVTAIVIGCVALWSLMVASAVVMGAEWGNPLGAGLLALVAVLAATGVMALVGGAARTSEQAGNLQAIVAVSLAMLGGAFVPTGSSDTLLGRLSLLTPNAWYVRGLGELGAGGIGDAMPAIGVLLAFAVVTGAAAVALAGKMLRP